MKSQLKLGLYVVTVVGTLLFGTLFLQSWRRSTGDAVESGGVRGGKSNAPAMVETERQTGTSAEVATHAETNAVVGGARPDAQATNVAGSAGGARTNLASGTGEGETTAETEVVPMRMANAPQAGFGSMILYGLLAVLALVGLGVLVAYDISQYAAQRATQVLFDDRGADLEDTDYEKIEKVYGNGEFLEAVRMLREFLGKNPRAVHAQLRIAEIYEKDLHNPLASALEYEEVLKLPLEPTRRGWTAIHLVNLYNRLDKPAQAVALMQQICVECADTPAAVKARERLEALGEAVPEAPATGTGPGPEAGGGGSGGSPGLPPGFRRKR